MFHSCNSGPSLFMVLSKEDAVIGWRALMGPKDPTEAKDNAPESYELMNTHTVTQ